MGKQGLVSILFFLLYSSGAASDAKAILRINPRYAREGQNVTMTCEIYDWRYSPIKIDKVLKYGTVTERETVSTNDVLSPKYAAKNRFTIKGELIGMTTIITIYKTYADNEDSAIYECGVDTDVGVGSYYTLEVFRDIENVAFRVNNTELPDKSQVDLTEGEPVSLECSASRALPLPRMQVFSAGLDITEKLSQVHHKVPGCKDDPACLLHFYYNSSIYDSQFKASWRDNGVLKCKAFIPEEYGQELGHHFEPKEISLMLNVYHRPHFNCSQTHWAPKETPTKSITCPLHSNPELLAPIVLSSEENSIVLKPGESKDGISLDYKKSEGTKPGEMQVMWTNLQDRHFGTYKVVANNSIGGTTFTFSLKEGDDPSLGSASANSLSTWSLVIVAMVAANRL